MANLFSFPSTLPAPQPAKTRAIRILTDDVQVMLDEGSRSFKAGAVVEMSEAMYNVLSPGSFGVILEDAGGLAPLPDDVETRAINFTLDLTAVADGTVETYTSTVAGDIVSMFVTVTDPVTTAATTSLSLEIDGTPTTGGVLVLSNVNGAAEGAVVASTAITGANTVAVGEDIELIAGTTTPFTEGTANVTLMVVVADVVV